ncbi:MAG TPA: SDR family NAD(P)-dependent oxidoreductase, partial [Steroidobacteraceae bacterium]|nr:SDR family NAD(P)-dependent oxidoreductase [Steroidobacteraceae bacterium]
MRSVIVTGGSRGLGLAIVRRLAASGFRVIAVARTGTPELSAVAGVPDEGGGMVHFRSYDFGQMEGIGPLVTSLH